MPTIELSQLVVRSPHAIVEQIGDQLVVLDLEHDRYLNVDGVGQALWGMANEPISLDTMIERLLSEYDVERFVLERDVVAFINQTIDLGIFCAVAAP
jgi:Coenzyme PQQ synthesis protein D (PqqD)